MKNIKQTLITIGCLLILFIICYSLNLKNSKDFDDNQFLKTQSLKELQLKPEELFSQTWDLIQTSYFDDELNKQNWERWKKRYADKIKTEEDAYIAINSMLASLNDPYSKFLNKNEFEEQNSTIDSKIYGIGVNIVSNSGKIYIMSVIKGAPADIGGLKAGDMILKINGNDVKGDNLFQAANYIKGSLNSLVELEILRGDKKLIKKIKRAEIKIKTVEARNLNKDIGYIRIISFISSNTPVEFIEALNKLSDSKALILDLRGNTGGLFQNAVFVANMFLEKGDIVHIIGRKGQDSAYVAENNDYVYDKPLVVLVDGESASASEIVSAALKENNRAIIIGTKTYGKGVVQKVYSMPNKTGLNLTIARYLTPSGNDINKKGIEPNYRVEITKADFENNNDSQLNFAKNILQNELERSKLAVQK